MTLYKHPLTKRHVTTVRIFAAWGRLASKKAILEAYRFQEVIVRDALQTYVLSSLVIRGYLTRTIFENGEELYQITPAGRELARRLEDAGPNTSTR